MIEPGGRSVLLTNLMNETHLGYDILQDGRDLQVLNEDERPGQSTCECDTVGRPTRPSSCSTTKQGPRVRRGGVPSARGLQDLPQTIANFFYASNKSGKRSEDIQSNNAKQAAEDPTEDGTAIPSQPFEPKLARDVAFR
jgi:hypothetical protein